MEKLISVIVPVYNVSKYLRQCVDSIINQSYKNLEIVLVDDGSTDSSGDLCDEYAKVDSRVKVIHKENGGLSDARNAGLDIATGEYVGFADSDDFIHCDMYRILAMNLEMENADMAIGNWKEFHDGDEETLTDSRSGNTQVFLGIETLEFLIYGKDGYRISFSVWDRLYKRELINEFRFPKGKCYEDVVWSAKVFYKAKKSVYVDRDLYYYRRRDDSIVGLDSKGQDEVSERAITDEIPQIEEQIRFLSDIGQEEMADEVMYYLYEMIFSYYTRCHYGKNHLQDKLLDMVDNYKPWAKQYMRKPVGMYRKCVLYMSVYCRCILVGVLYIKKILE
jgi:glycosyltransferase involved in cell wall biosynthesis